MDDQIDISSLRAWYSLTGTNTNASASTEKDSLKTGEGNNTAAPEQPDIPEIIRSKIHSIEALSRNIKDCIPHVQSVDAALEDMQMKLSRMLELALQASGLDNGVDINRRVLNIEFQQLKAEIDRIADSVDLEWKTLLEDKSCG